MAPVLNSLAIYGYAPKAADLALRKVLKFRDCRGPVIIIDYRGRGAAVLDKTNMQNLNHHPVYWYDLADRLHPVYFFHLERSEHFRSLIQVMLRKISNIKPAMIADKTLEWASEAAYQMSNNGAVSLGALLKTIASPETRRWFLDTQPDPNDLNNLIDLLRWALRYPLVYSISEGTNRCDLIAYLKEPCTTWIEVHSEYFERVESSLVLTLVETAVEDALKTLQKGKPSTAQMISVVHFFPFGLLHTRIPNWIAETSSWVRHIAVHSLECSRPLNTLAFEWAKAAGQIWIIGGMKALDPKKHQLWLDEEEINQVNGLAENFIMVRNNASHRRLVVKIATRRIEIQEACRQRYQSVKSLKPTTVRQYSTAILFPDETNADNQQLYKKLCSAEFLRIGWFRVAGSKKNSHGIDNVTVERFQDNLEVELAALSDELLSRTYRGRPLRRINIPKSDGGMRPISIVCIRDRVVQNACLILLDQIFDPTFSHFSFGYRYRRSAHHAIALTRSLIKAGGVWAVIADIKKCFDSLDHEVLLNQVAMKIRDQAILDLIQQWLTADVLDFSEFIPNDMGVPQGESLSPLLANVYLDPLDKHFERMGMRFVRYADDITIITGSEDEAVKVLKIMSDFLNNPLHLDSGSTVIDQRSVLTDRLS